MIEINLFYKYRKFLNLDQMNTFYSYNLDLVRQQRTISNETDWYASDRCNATSRWKQVIMKKITQWQCSLRWIVLTYSFERLILIFIPYFQQHAIRKIQPAFQHTQYRSFCPINNHINIQPDRTLASWHKR